MATLRDLPLWARFDVLHRQGFFDELPDPKYQIAWENGDGVSVTTPSSSWLKMALEGGILPPVEAYHSLKFDGQQITNGHVLHAEVIPAMSEGQAMEYLLRKDVPREVWDRPGANWQRYSIQEVGQLPSRSFRNAWVWAGDAVVVDVEKAANKE